MTVEYIHIYADTKRERETSGKILKNEMTAAHSNIHIHNILFQSIKTQNTQYLPTNLSN